MYATEFNSFNILKVLDLAGLEDLNLLPPEALNYHEGILCTNFVHKEMDKMNSSLGLFSICLCYADYGWFCDQQMVNKLYEGRVQITCRNLLLI